MSTRRVILFDSIVVSREPLLRAAMQTEWEILTVPERTQIGLARRLVPGAQAFISNEFPAELAPLANDLRLIHCVGAGIDLFDLSAIPPGCTLCNVYEHEIPIAEYILMCLLMLTTGVVEADRELRGGRWRGSGRYDGAFHGELHGKTLGLIGFGHIGQAVAQRARAMGLRVIAVRRTPAANPLLEWCGSMSDLPRLLTESDCVAVVCPLTDETKGLLGEIELRLMRPHALLINTARAAIIDEQALYCALSERWIAGAALDVWYQYPPDPEAGQHGSQFPFHELPNVIVTPHYSGWTEAMIQRRYQRIAENLDHLARGEPLERAAYVAPGGK